MTFLSALWETAFNLQKLQRSVFQLLIRFYYIHIIFGVQHIQMCIKYYNMLIHLNPLLVLLVASYLSKVQCEKHDFWKKLVSFCSKTDFQQLLSLTFNIFERIFSLHFFFIFCLSVSVPEAIKLTTQTSYGTSKHIYRFKSTFNSCFHSFDLCCVEISCKLKCSTITNRCFVSRWNHEATIARRKSVQFTRSNVLLFNYHVLLPIFLFNRSQRWLIE